MPTRLATFHCRSSNGCKISRSIEDVCVLGCTPPRKIAAYLLPHLGWIAARAPNRVNRAHGPTKENRQNLGNFWIFPAHAKNGPRWAQMGPGGFFMPEKGVPAPFGALPAIFCVGRENRKDCILFRSFLLFYRFGALAAIHPRWGNR